MAKIVKMPNRKFVMDRNNPERTMNYFHECLDNELNKLSKRMQQICDKYDLYHPADELFVDYDPIQLGEIIVPIQTMFTRCDFLLRMFECQLMWTGQELELASLSKEVKKIHQLFFDRIHIMRNAYVDGVGVAVLQAFRRCLLLTETGKPLEKGGAKVAMPVSVPKPVGYRFNEILVKNFGDVMDYPGDFASPAFKKMETLLNDVGDLTGLKPEVKKIQAKIRTMLK